MVDIAVKNALIETRHHAGLYSIKELCTMFGCGRAKIDFALNTGQLKYISPNNRERFIYLEDFLSFMKTNNVKKGDLK